MTENEGGNSKLYLAVFGVTLIDLAFYGALLLAAIYIIVNS